MLLSHGHLQRLPLISIVRTHIFGKIVVDKNPRFARLGTGQLAQLGAPSHFLGMHLEKCRGLCQIERAHIYFELEVF